ncbi:MAG: helix-turn-helix domain-containing protein [Armatimonadota bacterium]
MMAVREMATETREVMTVEQAAEYLQMEPEDVRRLIEQREFPAFETVPGEWRVDRAALRRWIDRRTAKHLGEPIHIRAMSDTEMRRLREDTAAGRAAGLARRRPLTKEWLERVTARREAIRQRRGGKPFPSGWIREAIEEGRL